MRGCLGYGLFLAAKHRDIEFATLKADTEYLSDGTEKLNVKVQGGRPAPNSFQWTLPDGSILLPGHRTPSFHAYWPAVNNALQHFGAKLKKLTMLWELFTSILITKHGSRHKV